MTRLLFSLLFLFGLNSAYADIQTGDRPYYPVIVEDKLYVGGAGNNNIYIIDSNTDKLIKTLSYGDSANRHFVIHGSLIKNRLYLNDFYFNGLVVVDVDTEEVIDYIRGPETGFSAPYYQASLNNKAFITNHTAEFGRVSVFDAITNTFTLVTTGRDPTYPQLFGDKILAPSFLDEVITVIDSKTYATFNIDIGFGSNYISTVGDKIYVTGTSFNGLSYNMRTGARVTFPINITNFSKTAGTDVYFVGQGVRVLDSKTDTVVKQLNLPGSLTYGGAILNNKFYFGDNQSGSVIVIDLNTREVVKQIPVGLGEFYWLVSLNNKIYMPDSANHRIIVIDPILDVIIDTENNGPILLNFE